MDDEPERSAAAARKAELKLQQLELQNRQLRHNIATSVIKDRYDRNPLWAWLRNTGTIILALLVPVGGWLIQTKISSDTRRDELYIATLNSLDSRDSAVRQGAIPMLASYARATKDVRSNESLALIANRLTTETDDGVLREMIWVAGELPASAIPEFTRSNRFSAAHFGRSLGAYIAAEEVLKNNLVRGDKPGAAIVRDQNVEDAIQATLASQLGDIHIPQEAELSAISERSYFRLNDLLEIPSVEHTCMRERERVQGLITRQGAAAAVRKYKDDLESSARALASTSSALLELLRANQGHLDAREVDLDHIVILFGDMQKFNFREADLRGAFLSGDGSGTDFSFADLVDASIEHLEIGRAKDKTQTDFADAKVRGLTFGSLNFSDPTNRPDFSNVALWQARVLSVHKDQNGNDLFDALAAATPPPLALRTENDCDQPDAEPFDQSQGASPVTNCYAEAQVVTNVTRQVCGEAQLQQREIRLDALRSTHLRMKGANSS